MATMPQRLPGVAALLALPLLAAALLLMHGLDARTSVPQAHAPTAEAPIHAHGAEAAPAHDGECGACAVGHVMAAVAIIVTALGLRAVRRAVGLRLPVLWAALVRPCGLMGVLPRPPDPAWVRLSVMLR